MKYRLLAFWRDFEHDATAIVESEAFVEGPTDVCRSIQVSAVVNDQPPIRTRAIGAVILRAEGIEDGLLAFWRDFEHDATAQSHSVAFVERTTGVGRPVEVSLLVKDQACIGISAIGAVRPVVRTETVEDDLFALRGELEYDALSVVPAVVGRPI